MLQKLPVQRKSFLFLKYTEQSECYYFSQFGLLSSTFFLKKNIADVQHARIVFGKGHPGT